MTIFISDVVLCTSSVRLHIDDAIIYIRSRHIVRVDTTDPQLSDPL